MILGQLARSYAMAHAGTNFSHVVVMNREQDHVLVKTGIYAFIRHPSYFGFFWWGVGTQFMLGNPVCAVGYAVVLWKFFSSRIRGRSPRGPPRPIFSAPLAYSRVDTDARVYRGGETTRWLLRWRLCAVSCDDDDFNPVYQVILLGIGFCVLYILDGP